MDALKLNLHSAIASRPWHNGSRVPVQYCPPKRAYPLPLRPKCGAPINGMLTTKCLSEWRERVDNHLQDGKIALNCLVASTALLLVFYNAQPAMASSLESLLQSNPTSVRTGFKMSGMSMKNFDIYRYVGRWYEVLSIKKGFAGQGQEDCHCTQGLYSFNEEAAVVEVDTFCVHGSPTGYLTGIKGKVSCVSEENLAATESTLEMQQMIQEKCFLRFPSIPFIPKSVYNVISTDYQNFAIVSGSRDLSFVQVYSRTPNPGPEFLETQRGLLKSLGYKLEDVRETPQDCPDISTRTLMEMMSPQKMQDALTNVLPTGASASVQPELEKILREKAKNLWLSLCGIDSRKTSLAFEGSFLFRYI